MHCEDKRLVDNVLISDKIMAIEVMVKMTVELEECPTEYLRYSLRQSSISPVEADTEDYKNFIKNQNENENGEISPFFIV